jgi:Putative Ig domain
MPKKANSTVILVVAMLLLDAEISLAGSATWNASTASADWNTATNWTPATVPNGAADTATFGVANLIDVFLSANTEVDGINFRADANLFEINVPPPITLTLSGSGIMNSSSATQQFATTVTGGIGGRILFTNNANAGNQTTFFNVGGASSGGGGGTTQFLGASSAGSASFINEGGGVSGANAAATIFENSSTAASATFINTGGVAGAATGFTFFGNTSTAGNATFENGGGTVSGANGGSTNFVDASTAGSAIISNDGAAVSGATGGGTFFFDSSSAANSKLIAARAAGGGGSVNFVGDSAGATSSVSVFGNGSLNITAHNPPGVTIGSIEGDGIVFLGSNTLTVGSNNLDTTFSGVIQDAGLNGIFAKIGTGVLTFQGGASNDHIADTVALNVASSSTINLNYSGTPDTVRALLVDGAAQPPGLYGGAASGAPNQLAVFAGTGTIEVTATGPPIITSPLSATATVGQLFVYQVTATGAPTSYTAAPLPPGMTFDDARGILGGTPTTPGTTQIQITASNSLGTGMTTLTLTVQPAPGSGPVVMSGASITARAGVPFSYEVFTTGGSPTARLSVSGLPPGLNADPETGRLSSASPTAGNFGLTLTVTDGPNVITSTLQLTFTTDLTIPVIVSPRETSLTTGQFFSYTIAAPTSNPSDPTTFNVIGSLPRGLGFDPATGTISGTFNVHAQNGGALLGNVQLVSSNSSGAGTSPLSFFQSVPATAVNISTRLAVGTSDNVLIGGFIVTGNAPKKMIVRAVGPELTALGVPNALQDTTLELHDGTGAVIGTNDDWKITQIGGAIADDQADAIHTSGAGPTDDRESAIIATLAPYDPSVGGSVGIYTAIVRGKDGTTGVGSVELYDLGTASLDVSSKAQLANISTRGVVQTADNVMIGGFIVQGDLPAKVIVRAIGPSLTTQGVAGALQDPTLELHDGTGATIAFDDNWKDTQQTEIEATDIPPTDDRESAIVATLAPGNYTAIVRGKNNTTGVALVEAYVLQ